MTLRISSALKLDLEDLEELDRRLIRVKLKGGDQATQRITDVAAGPSAPGLSGGRRARRALI